MDGNGDDRIGWLADGMAAGMLGGAVGTSLLLLGWPQLGVAAAATAVLAALTLLRQIKPEPRRFSLPTFTLPAVDAVRPATGERLFDIVAERPARDVLELTEVAAEDALLLVDRLDPPLEDSRVVRLFAHRPLPTPGELRQRIQDHLGAIEGGNDRDGRILELEVDAAAALRQALGDLRRSLA